MRPAIALLALRPFLTPLRLFCLLAATLIVFGPASLTKPRAAWGATIVPTTTYTQNTSWTTGGSPYILNGNVTVAAGVTLTIEPGVIVKLNGTSRTIFVDGIVSAVGTAANHIVFSSYQDDTAGGDSNGDGSATTGAPGQWAAITVRSGNSASALRYADVRFGGWGSANWAQGALQVQTAGTSVTVEDSTLKNNQRAGIKVGTADTSGAIVRRTTLESNGNGISANGGWVTVENSTIKSNGEDGLWFSLGTSFAGPTSTLMDSEVRANGRYGVRLQLDPAIDAAKWPHGNRNNIYENVTRQLDSLGTKRTVDWKHNYWGEQVYHYANAAVCQTQGQNSLGKLAFRSSQASPPDGPVSATTYTLSNPTTTCAYDRVAIGPIEFSPFPFRGPTGLPIGQTLTACDLNPGAPFRALARNASKCLSDPVNTATGSGTHAVTDLTLPGIGVPFEFRRSYNSIDPTPGPLGPGWTHSDNGSLTIKANGDVTARAGSGQQLEFIKNADGSYTDAAGSRATLTLVGGVYELVTTEQVHARFDSAGKLTSLKDRNDKGLTFAYDGNGRLSTITDATSRQVTLAYDGAGLLTSVTAPGGRSVGYAYTNGKLTSVTDVASKVWTYTYDSYGFLEKEVDPLQHTTFRNVYGSDGRVVEQYDALNNKTTFAWNPTTQVATITDARNNVWKDEYANNVLTKRTDALNNTTQFATDSDLNETGVTSPTSQTTTMAYDTRGNLTSATAPASLGSAQKTFTYDANNNVTSVTDARGKVTTYGYDANGNNTSVVQDGITVVTNAYNGSGQLTSSTDGRGKTTTYTYDTSGNLESVSDPLGNKTTYTYDSAGRVTSMVEPRGNVQGADPNLYKTTYTYDAASRLLTETDPLGNVTTNVYDNAGNRTSTTDARNKTTTYTYDAANRVLTETVPDAGVTTFTYDAVGNKLTDKDPRDKTTTYTYDADNRLASMTTPLGNKTTYAYDANGNLTKQVEPRGNVQGANPDDYDTLYTYDAAGRMLTEADPLGNTTTYTYDAVGNQISVQDANNHTTTYVYDGLNRLTTVTAPGGASTNYTYDNAGNLLTRTDDNNHTTSYQYDDAGHQISMTRPLNRQWTYGYDAAGNLTSQVDANGNSTQTAGDGTTTYTYDRAARQTAIDYSDSTPDVTFSYDGVGNSTQMSDGVGTQTYTYDNVNRLASVTRGADTFSYLYDLAGNITRRTYPDATVIDYSYDDDSRMSSVTSGGNTTSYAYDAAANVTATTLPASNGHVEERTYDLAGRLTRVKNVKAGNTLVDFTYTLDAVGNPTQVVRAGSAAGTTTYLYDNRDRVTEVCYQASCAGGSDPFIRWTYDGVGNRLTEARPAGTTNYTYNAADELTQAGSASYSYDQNGNETHAVSRTFAYDLANRVSSTASGGSTTTYSYSGDGDRISAVLGATTTRYLWDGTHAVPQVAVEQDGAGSTLRRYVYGHRRLSVVTESGTDYYHYDQLDSVANLTSGNGVIEWTYDYEPFGSVRLELQEPAALANSMRFTAESLDSTGLYYLRARQYDPSTGRFLQRDPVMRETEEPSVSLYGYVDAKPTTMVDPTGEKLIPSRRSLSAARLPASVQSAAVGPPIQLTSECDDETSITSSRGTIHGSLKILCTLPTLITIFELCIETPDPPYRGFADSVCRFMPHTEPSHDVSQNGGGAKGVGVVASMSRDCVRGRHPYRLRWTYSLFFEGATITERDEVSKARRLRCR